MQLKCYGSLTRFVCKRITSPNGAKNCFSNSGEIYNKFVNKDAVKCKILVIKCFSPKPKEQEIFLPKTICSN